MNHDMNFSAHLRAHLKQIAERLVALGTEVETHRLIEIARVIRSAAPGTAAALVDWDGSEVSRLRAFAAASCVVLRLPIADHRYLVERFEQTTTSLAAA